MKLIFFLVFSWIVVGACTSSTKNDFDYVQYERFDLRPYDIDAQLMLPDATAGIGTSLKPEVNYEEGGFRWELNVGRQFQLLIEDYGDNALRFEEFKRKLLKPSKFFHYKIIKEEPHLLIYQRVVKGNFVQTDNKKYHIYALKKINDIYYEFMSPEAGERKKVIDFMYHSIQSFQANGN
jgi:hypothetical protein